MNSSPVIRCPRITLRRLELCDAPAISAYRSDPDVARYQSWETCTLAQAQSLCQSQISAVFGQAGTWFQLAIVLRGENSAADSLIGDCGLHFADDGSEQIEIGITLGREAQGKGLARETVGGVLDLAFGTMAKHRVSARTDALNTKAASLLEKCGFRREGHFVRCAWFKGAWCDEVAFAMLGSEWAGNALAGRASVEWGKQGAA